MDMIECTIQVSWQHRVLFADNVFDPANSLLRQVLSHDGPAEPRRVLVVLDDGLVAAQPGLSQSISAYFAAHSDALCLAHPPIVQPGGEQAKASWSYVSDIHAAINSYDIDRHSYLLAVGGGAFLDVAGLAAATAHRGVRHVRIPSTTLSQCDSGVGIKNGINGFGKKNFIGTFCPPFAVINDFQLLNTLTPRDKRAGYSEAVKVACVRDRGFFETIEREARLLSGFEPDAMRRLIHRCATLHINHIAAGGDPLESGLGRPMDFGHWAAHKLEQLSGFRLRHGEAVAIGLALDVIYSRRGGYLDEEEAERVLGVLQTLGFDLFAPELLAVDERCELLLPGGLEEFRQHLGGALTITLLKRIGSEFETHEMSRHWILESLEELRARWGKPQTERLELHP
jgi:3-dehydroquinate synthase